MKSSMWPIQYIDTNAWDQLQQVMQNSYFLKKQDWEKKCEIRFKN